MYSTTKNWEQGRFVGLLDLSMNEKWILLDYITKGG